jgi:protease I
MTRPNLAGFRVAVIATDGFEQSELEEPVKALKEAAATVHILAPKAGRIQGYKHHEKADIVAVDKELEDTRPEDYDGLVLPGGALNSDALRVMPRAKTFALSFNRSRKPMAAICHAPWLLVSANLVRERVLTSYHTIADDIINAGGNWIDREVVVDGNWVTSRQPDDLPAFNQALLKLFSQARAGEPARAG